MGISFQDANVLASRCSACGCQSAGTRGVIGDYIVGINNFPTTRVDTASESPTVPSITIRQEHFGCFALTVLLVNRHRRSYF